MGASENSGAGLVLTTALKEVLASSLSTLGRFHNDEYVLNRHCLDSVKDIIRFLKRDNEHHEIRRYLGQAKVVQSDLIHIVKASASGSETLFELTIRLLTVLTCSVQALFGEEVPSDKVGRSIYMNLVEHLQEYKAAFDDVDFWRVICEKLNDLFEVDWSERSESQCLLMEKLLVLIRNVLHIPVDTERGESDVSAHEKLVWSLRWSHILHILLYLSSNKNEQRYYLHLLEIFTLVFREQDPKLLALSQVERCAYERNKEVNDLLSLREKEKMRKNMYRNTRTFDSTFVLKGLKSFSGRDMIYHGSLEDMKESVVSKDKKRGKPRNHKQPIETEPIERRSTFSVRIYLREFCVEFLTCSYNNMMNVVKEKIMSGAALPNDDSFYFWALKFFLEFNCAHNLNIKLVSDSINMQTFHFLQRSMDENFEKLTTEKKNRRLWVRKLHLILKAYHALLQTIKWMDSSKEQSARDLSATLKSQIFYVAEYRDMAIVFLTRYDPDVFSNAYLRDVIETTHLTIKLLEEYTKNNKIVVRKRIRKKSGKVRKTKKGATVEPVVESNMDIWGRIKDDVEKSLTSCTEFPDVPPFDVLLDLSEEEQKERTMKNVQRLLHEGKVIDGIGLLRSARKAWPENDHFGSDGMSAEEETTALREICLAELGNERIVPMDNLQHEHEDDEDGSEGVTDEELCEDYKVTEESFDMMSYKWQLVNKKVVEACSVLLQNYAKNSDYTNHCIIKILFRIGWECGMPAMMYQASLFMTLLNVMTDKYKQYKEINDFAIHLLSKFRKEAMGNKFTFVELLFWKDPSVAEELQERPKRCIDESGDLTFGAKARKAASWSVEEEDELERLWKECNPDVSIAAKVDWVKSNLINPNRSLLSIRRKLKEMGLLSGVRRAARQNIGKEWIEEEIDDLTRLFKENRDAADIVSVICENLTLKRTKKSVRQKLLELGLAKSLSDLRKKKRGRSGDDEESESTAESDEDTGRGMYFSIDERRDSVRRVQHMTNELEWLKRVIQYSMDEEDYEVEAYPVCAMEQYQIDALEKEEFVTLLRRLGLEGPPEHPFWRIPKGKRSELEESMKLLSEAIDGWLPPAQRDDGSGSEDEFEKLRRMREAAPASEPRKKIVRKRNTSGRKKHKSIESDEDVQFIAMPKEKENVPEEDESMPRSGRRSRIIDSGSESDDEVLKERTNTVTEKSDFDKLLEESLPVSFGDEEADDSGKRRRRISSESSEEERVVCVTKKRSRLIDSDSEEG